MNIVALKKLWTLLLSLVLLLSCCACGPAPSQTEQPAPAPEAAEPVILKFGLTVAANQPYAVSMQQFADRVAELSEDRLQVEMFFDGSLGGDRELYESLQVNAVQLTAIGPASICNLIPEYALFDLPCVFETVDAAHGVQDGAAGQALLQAAEDSGVGLKALAYYDNGWYQISNNHAPLTRVEQLQGVDIRSMQSSLQMHSWECLGANPTVIAWNELYMSLQQGLVTAQETTVGSFYSAAFYDSQSYLTLSDRLFHVMVLFISEQCWDKLSPEQRDIISQAAAETAAAHRDFNQQQTAAMLDLLREEHGVQVDLLEEGQWQLMRELSQPVYEETRQYIANDSLYQLFLDAAAEANGDFPR